MGGAEKSDSELEYTYSGSKAALNMLIRVLAFEVRARAVTVIALKPRMGSHRHGGLFRATNNARAALPYLTRFGFRG